MRERETKVICYYHCHYHHHHHRRWAGAALPFFSFFIFASSSSEINYAIIFNIYGIQQQNSSHLLRIYFVFLLGVFVLLVWAKKIYIFRYVFVFVCGGEMQQLKTNENKCSNYEWHERRPTKKCPFKLRSTIIIIKKKMKKVCSTKANRLTDHCKLRCNFSSLSPPPPPLSLFVCKRGRNQFNSMVCAHFSFARLYVWSNEIGIEQTQYKNYCRLVCCFFIFFVFFFGVVSSVACHIYTHLQSQQAFK